MGLSYLVLLLAAAVYARPNIDVSEDRLDLPEERGDLFEGDMLDVDPDKRNAIYNRLWPNARIPYQFDPQYESQFTSSDKQRIQEAFADYAKYTCIRVVPKTSSDTAYINIIRGGGCYSNVGRIGRKQTLSLGRGCTGKGTIIHEFMHAAGFHHEQGRTDRDNYITIKYENISPGKESQFKKYTVSQVQDLGAPYDYGSVMHYSAYAFSKNRQPTIVPKQQGAKIGNRAGFSQYDIYKLNKLYKCPNQGTLGPYSTLKPGATTKPTPPTKPTTPTPSIFRESFSCNFESGTCGFRGSASDQFDWTRYRGQTPSSNTGPYGDHTTGRGYYMYTEASNPRKAGEKAHLMSPEFHGTVGRVYCLNFWYSMNGTGMGRLNVFNKPVGTTTATGIFSKIGNQGNRWNNAKVSITYQKPFQFVFEGIVGSNFLSDIAIDDVSIAAGTCGQVVTNPPTKPVTKSTSKATQPPTTSKPTVLKGGFTCNFNTGTCGFTQEQNDKFDWTRQRGSTSSSSTGPTGDRSGNGYYYYIETSSPRVTGDTARIRSPVMEATGQYCLKFYYHMYGADMGTLKVLSVQSGRSPQVLFQKKGDQGNAWRLHQSQLTLNGRTQLVFEGIRGSSFRGDMAIDDVSVVPGACGTVTSVTTSKPVTNADGNTFKCDFEKGFCGFQEDPSDAIDWMLGSGNTPSGGTGPSGDHTTGTGKYAYLEASAPATRGDQATISTPLINGVGQYCVQYWYHTFGTSVGSLAVYKMENGVRTKLNNHAGSLGDQWVQSQVLVGFTSPSKIIFQATVGSSWSGDIAIDDILIHPGICKSSPSTATPVTLRPSTYTPIPWECHFERSDCGMTMSKPTDSLYAWKRHVGQTPSAETGPSTDHTLKSAAGYYVYAEASSPADAGHKAWLDTPVFAGQKTCLKFYYNLNGADVDTLNVYLGSDTKFYSQPIHTVKGNTGDLWREVKVGLQSSTPFRVRFEAVRGSNYRGDIAIDDISFSNNCDAVVQPPVGRR